MSSTVRPALNTVASLMRSHLITDVASLSARLLLSSLFLLSAYSKLAEPGGTVAYIASFGLPFPLISFAGAVAIEFGGGMALVVGYHTRAVTLLLALFCSVTALVFHAQWADENQLLHFFKNIAIAGGLLQVAATGPGRWSVDASRMPKLVL